MYAAEAAVELLVGHRRWLGRDDFVDACVEIDAGRSGEATAWVDWHAAVKALDAGRLPCADSEAQMLRIAVSLAEGLPVDLRDCLSALDGGNAVLVARTLLHAGGRRDAVVTLAGVAGW